MKRYVLSAFCGIIVGILGTIVTQQVSLVNLSSNRGHVMNFAKEVLAQYEHAHREWPSSLSEWPTAIDRFPNYHRPSERYFTDLQYVSNGSEFICFYPYVEATNRVILSTRRGDFYETGMSLEEAFVHAARIRTKL